MALVSFPRTVTDLSLKQSTEPVQVQAAIGGGFWTGLAFEVLVAGDGGILDLAALLISGLLTISAAWMVFRAGGRRALLVYLVVAGVVALIGPALVF